MSKELFLTQYAQIRQHNSGNSSFKQELNKFSDLGPSEKLKYLGIKSSMAPSKQFMNSTYRADLLESRQTLPDRYYMICS
uniref:Cathepsin propeptide inhibitor domain-containing protein n=1 Tax=Daphnia galeata TaxID=27404 RepID=A0A8J2RKE5_9CRUS|nr:unnamed protein product [Daphnia galeata]